MIKRPLNEQFSTAVKEGRKITTIRAKPWPCWKPIMLYNWSGAAYRSKQINVAAIESLAELHSALIRYEADVDGEAPSEHRQMMDRAAAIIQANAKTLP